MVETASQIIGAKMDSVYMLSVCIYVFFLIFYFEIIIDSQEVAKKCPGRSQVDKTLTDNTGDMGSVADPGKFHMLQIPRALGH